MPAIYVMQQGARLHLQSRRLRVLHEGQDVQTVPLLKLSQIVLFGNVGITTPLLRTLLRTGTDVIFLDQHGRYHGRLIGHTTPHADLRLWQYRRAVDADAALGLAQRFVDAKIANTQFLHLTKDVVQVLGIGVTS